MKKWSRHLLAAGALALGMSAAHADDNNTLYFYNWDRVRTARDCWNSSLKKPALKLSIRLMSRMKPCTPS